MLLLRRGTRLFRLRLGGRFCCRLLDRFLQNLLALRRVGGWHEVADLRPHGMHRTGRAKLTQNARLQMPQGIGKVPLADLVHRNLQRAVRILPLAAVEQAARGRHTKRHVLIKRVDVLTGQSIRHRVARLDAHAAQAVLLCDLLFRFGKGFTADDFFQPQLDHHYRVIIPKRERTHLARGEVLFFRKQFTVLK